MHDLDFLFWNIFCVAVKVRREKTSFISIRRALSVGGGRRGSKSCAAACVDASRGAYDLLHNLLVLGCLLW